MGSSSSRRGGRRWLWLAIVIVVVLILAWCAISFVQAYRAAQHLRSNVDVATTHARSFQAVELARDIPAISASAEQFSNSVSGPLWEVMARLPVVGSTTGSAQDLATAAVAMAAAA